MTTVCVIMFALVSVEPSAPDEHATGPLWVVDAPILLPGPAGSFDTVAVKDPSVVFHDGRWHVFYTARGKDRYSLGYANAETLPSLRNAEHHCLHQLRSKKEPYAAAPQVFFFEPQQTWYLVYQTRDSNYQPVYSTTKTLSVPESWTSPGPLVMKKERQKWIDFWVICDETHAYLFYTRDHHGVYAMSTPLTDFPKGFSNPQKVFAPVHEAVHLYKVRDGDEYNMLYEMRGEEGQRRFGLARAQHLRGPWRTVTDNFASETSLVFPEGETPWTEEVSHGELIRTGINQHLEYDPGDTRFLIQGLRKEQHTGPYPSLPWQLGIIRKQ